MVGSTNEQDTVAPRGAGAARSQTGNAASLTVLWSPHPVNLGMVYTFERAIQLGRGLLPMAQDERMSRRHATLSLDPDGLVRLSDLGSTNGSEVDFVPVGEAVLADGAVLLCGATLLLFRDAGTTLKFLVESPALLELPVGGDLAPSSPFDSELEELVDPERRRELEARLLRSVTAFRREVSPQSGVRWWLNRNAYFQHVGLPEAVRSRGGRTLPGCSPLLQRLGVSLSRYAATDHTVLLLGENGAGKEIAAGVLHARSGRRQLPFQALNCAIFERNLLAAELFGYRKGAFTGAEFDRKGAIEETGGGTLFLDEVGELPAEVQASLLRFLETREVKPLGGKTRQAEVRLIAATNRDLDEARRKGTFRDDLYYRLAQLRVVLPPLREHREDLWYCLVDLLRSRGLAEDPLPYHELEPETRFQDTAQYRFLRWLFANPWRGNYRELRNALENLVVQVFTDWKKTGGGRAARVPWDRCLAALLEADPAYASYLGTPKWGPSPQEPSSGGEEVRLPGHTLSKEQFLRVLAANDYTMSAVAKALKVSRQTVYEYLKRFELDVHELRRAKKGDPE
ncbi:MAG: hypothetical protein A2284_07975 [Deltaproteobacteria bacterium RIFOXYA12_FULL_61_11]|nr:MAG: hypothetical protein A2284_07975 [Deltaproteobacteria bacterium RIFOXYA12_FULL_61_11]